jgi:hypothetical protein
MNTIQAGKKVFSEEAIKRRAIHACAKVLTDKDMDAEVTVAKKNKKSQLTKHDSLLPARLCRTAVVQVKRLRIMQEWMITYY